MIFLPFVEYVFILNINWYYWILNNPITGTQIINHKIIVDVKKSGKLIVT